MSEQNKPGTLAAARQLITQVAAARSDQSQEYRSAFATGYFSALLAEGSIDRETHKALQDEVNALT